MLLVTRGSETNMEHVFVEMSGRRYVLIAQQLKNKGW